MGEGEIHVAMVTAMWWWGSWDNPGSDHAFSFVRLIAAALSMKEIRGSLEGAWYGVSISCGEGRVDWYKGPGGGGYCYPAGRGGGGASQGQTS